MIKPDNDVVIYFGNSSNSISQVDIKDKTEALSKIKNLIDSHSLFFVDQVHGKAGCYINQQLLESKFESIKNNKIIFLEKQSDFLYTNIRSVALGILTGDCLPISIYDKNKKIIAMVHAGWNGSLRGILNEAIRSLAETFNSNLADLVFYFGPAAKSCCYEVKSDFVDELKKVRKDWNEFVVMRDSKIFFDLIKFNLNELLESGILESAINIENNLCTICNSGFCSARRTKSSQRNFNFIILSK